MKVVASRGVDEFHVPFTTEILERTRVYLRHTAEIHIVPPFSTTWHRVCHLSLSSC